MTDKVIRDRHRLAPTRNPPGAYRLWGGADEPARCDLSWETGWTAYTSALAFLL